MRCIIARSSTHAHLERARAQFAIKTPNPSRRAAGDSNDVGKISSPRSAGAGTTEGSQEAIEREGRGWSQGAPRESERTRGGERGAREEGVGEEERTRLRSARVLGPGVREDHGLSAIQSGLDHEPVAPAIQTQTHASRADGGAASRRVGGNGGGLRRTKARSPSRGRRSTGHTSGSHLWHPSGSRASTPRSCACVSGARESRGDRANGLPASSPPWPRPRALPNRAPLRTSGRQTRPTTRLRRGPRPARPAPSPRSCGGTEVASARRLLTRPAASPARQRGARLRGTTECEKVD